MNCRSIIYCLVVFGMMEISSAQGRVVVTPAVADSAQKAVQKLGNEMIKGNFEYGQQRIYSRWKRRLAKRYGSMEKLNSALAVAAQQKIIMRLSVVAFQAAKPASFFSVWRSPKYDLVSNEPIKDASGKVIIVEHWLAVVPTITRVKIPDPNQGGRIRTLEEQSYTITVSEKGSNDWYFMTGLKPTIQDLRGMFPTLPFKADELGLPPSKAREIK